MKNKVYQIKILLKGSKPPIWRRVLVSSEILLSDFHDLIQIVMGWDNEHLHHFIKNNNYYKPKMEDSFLWELPSDIYYTNIRLSELLKKPKNKIQYEYDFGDEWEHDIILEKIDESEEKPIIPICLTGRNNSPPEDIGGILRYHFILETLTDPEDENYTYASEVVGDYFDPKHFDKNEINQLLKERFHHSNN